jgi:hypothetical protein
MAFTAGISRPQMNQGNSNTNQQNTFDRLLTITDYDTSKGYMYAEDDKGVKYELFVNQEEVLRADKGIADKKLDVTKTSYLGHKIDEKMKKTMPVGSKVIVQRSRVVEKDNGNGFKKTEVHRVVRVTEPEPHKTYEGIFTLNYRIKDGKKIVARVQDWAANGIDVNNQTGLDDLKAKMDESAALSGTQIGEFNVTAPTYGVQFRALAPTDRKTYDNKDILEVVDSSIPFDWMSGPLDEAGKEIKNQAHPISGDEMLSILDQYIEHISSHEAFKDKIDTMRIEVVPYKVLPASNNENMGLTKGDPEKDKHADKNPLYQLSHRVSFVDMENSDEGKIMGRNSAVKGIIQITGDKLEKVNGKPVEIPSNWVNRLHANNIRGHVHAFVRAEDGTKVEPHERLKLQQTVQNTQNNDQGGGYQAPAQAPARAPAPAQAPAPVAAPAPVSTAVDDPEFDPFQSDAPSAPAPAPAATDAAPARVSRFGQRK